ncbi:hypothetical protein I5G72_gp50 [Mycobacterium phage Collard]|uniref:Uncharacterized protein n=1 Tax=Mycobacterium phage Collard TaxID=2301704 RepID=A0A385DUS0_9CAUD|nr:hypothetical protein I5G72_gp50 [Mycobacterium phage Collard]AXQ63223.1 hypothetical protein SEA_COLLARD_49 [Mycobacterium phage Collard]UEM46443.1 hypothetical protein SEA_INVICTUSMANEO_49 [Mycobacterium phage InvictusManeo]
MTDISTVAGHVDLLRHARAEKARWSEIEEAAKSAIVEAIGTATEGTIDGRVVVTRKEITTNRLDGKALRKAHPDLADTFTRASVSNRIELAE